MRILGARCSASEKGQHEVMRCVLIYIKLYLAPLEHSCLALVIPLMRMQFTDILSLTLSSFAIVLYLLHLIPCYFVPSLSAHLNTTQQLLNHAEAIDAIPPGYKTYLDLYGYVYYGDWMLSHTPIQFGERICGDACGEQSRPGTLPAIASCYSARLDLQTLCPLLLD